MRKIIEKLSKQNIHIILKEEGTSARSMIYGRGMPYLKEHVPELLEGQRTRTQKQKSNFRFLGVHIIIVQDLINNNPGLNLRISQFAGMSSRRQIKSTTTTTMGGKERTRRGAMRRVNIGSNQKHTHYGKQNNNPSRPPQLWPVS